MELFKKIHQFFIYWYVRYLLATELYMVEPWEKTVVHIFFAIMFGLVWCFNYCIVLSAVGRLRGTQHYVEHIS